MTQLGIPPTPTDEDADLAQLYRDCTAAAGFTNPLSEQDALRVSVRADTYLDAFRFSDKSVYEALGLYRTEVESGS
jgi:hypothetical protein